MKKIFRIALPSIVSNITVPLLGLVDVSITGHLGSEAYIGAIAVGGMMFNIIYWLFAFLRMGTSGMTSQALGQRNLHEVTLLLLRSVGVALCASLILIAIQIPVSTLALHFIQSSPTVTRLALTYFHICIYGAPAALALFALNGWFIGMQNSRTPMLIAIIQNISNIVLSYCFVFGLNMKVEGVALGTVLAQYIGLLVALLSLHSHYRRHLLPHLHEGMSSSLSGILGQLCRYEAIKRFFTVNRDIFLRTLCLVGVHFTFVSAGARLGDTELAVNTLLMQFFTLYSYFMDGFAFAGEAIAGKAIGANNHRAYTLVVRHLFICGALMIILFTLIYATGSTTFFRLLTNDSGVIALATHYRIWIILIPLCGMAAFIWDGIYIGATATRQMLISMFISLLLFIVLYLLLVPSLGNHGLWIAFLSYLLMRGIVQTVLARELRIACGGVKNEE